MNLFLPFKKGFQILPVSPFFMSMSYKTYSEKLRDPKWQKKRLEILQMENFTCQWCGDKESTLHVHHFCYQKGKEPWDYEPCDLGALCENCHTFEHTKGIPQYIKDIVCTLSCTQLKESVQVIIRYTLDYYHKKK